MAPGLHLSNVGRDTGLSVMRYWMACMSMILANKICLLGEVWNMSFFFLALQSAFSIIVILVLKYLGVITTLAPFDYKKAKKWLPLSILLVLMTYTSLQSLRYFTWPIYSILKNFTLLPIFFGELFFLSKSAYEINIVSISSILLIILSSIIAAWSDISQTISELGRDKRLLENFVGGKMLDIEVDIRVLGWGYACILGNILFTTGYILSLKKGIRSMGFGEWDTIFYNSIITLPILTILSLLFEPWTLSNLQSNFPPSTLNSNPVILLMNALATLFLAYSSIWCIKSTTPTTYSVIGALSKLPTVVVWVKSMYGIRALGCGVLGGILGCVGAYVYFCGRLVQNEIDGERESVLPVAEEVADNGIEVKVVRD